MHLSHITIPTAGRTRLTRTPRELLALVRSLAIPARLLFSVADEHLHTVDFASQPTLRARDLSRRIQSVLPEVELQAPHVKPVRDRSHLQSLVGYLLEQPTKHGLPGHPALWPGHCFLDLIGARKLEGFSAAPLMLELPRLRAGSLLPHVSLPGGPIRPIDDEALRRLGAERIIHLAAAVVGLSDLPLNRSRLATRFRQVVVHAGYAAGLAPRDIAPHLTLTTRAMRKLAARPLDPGLLDALRLRAAVDALAAPRVWTGLR